ncbi:hypothetical protein ABEB36_013632 [Hypothenemus hampei]|uniref:Methyltransferase domain-containing protein n=1 Tax=Hypothenemus hampei TaxID=57062 RepID=A0ABD1E6Y1_HYPHA
MDDPKLYSTSSCLQTAANIYVINNYFNLIRWKNGDDNETVLDVGCGEGFTTTEILLPKLPKSVSKLEATDMNEKMIKVAKKKYKNTKRIEFFKLDINDRDTCDQFSCKFDHIFSFFCFHWIHDQRKAFKNIYTLLKPGGDFLLSLIGSSLIYDMYENLSKYKEWSKYFKKEMISPYHRCNDVKEIIEQLLKDTGFDDYLCVVKENHYTYNDWRTLKRAVISVNPVLPQLPISERSRYIEDINKELENICASIEKCSRYNNNNNEEVLLVPYELIVVYGRKPQN